MSAPKIFEIGKHYSAKKSFMSGPHHFVAADPLAFEGTHYSHYDGCYVYYFRSLKDGRITSWWLNDGYSYPSEDWREFFEPL